MSEIVNYIERLEVSNYSLKEDTYQKNLANNLTNTLTQLEKLRSENILLQKAVDRFDYIQNIRKNPTKYSPGVPLRPSRLDIKRNKNRKEKIVLLKVEILKLENELRST